MQVEHPLICASGGAGVEEVRERNYDIIITPHPRTADAALTRFWRAVGSITLSGPIPSKKFLNNNAADQPADHACD